MNPEGNGIDGPLIQVPLESLKRTVKDRKFLMDEVQAVASKVDDLQKGTLSKEQKGEALGKLAARLQKLKRRLDETSRFEEANLKRLHARVEHLNALGQPPKDHTIPWNRHRMGRILVDYMLREGAMVTAEKLSQKAGLEDLVDLHVFRDAWGVVEALQRRDCGPALQWCADNKSRLKKVESQLEFRLRVQEFIELIRRLQPSEAISYAQKHLAPYAKDQMKELQKVVACLAFGPSTSHPRYRPYFSDDQWAALVREFQSDLFRLNSMPRHPLLTIHLQAGLSALKTPKSFSEDGGSREDPLSIPQFRVLSESLPWAKHVHSKLVCAYTQQLMNEHNPPMVLPNGIVYSQAAVQALAREHPEGKVVCPKTRDVYEVKDIKRAFVS